MKGRKLGLFANIICSFTVMLFYLVIINTSDYLTDGSIVFLNIYLAIVCVALIVSLLSTDINPRVPKIVIVIEYASFCAISLLVNGNNAMMFQLMMMSLGAVSLFMSKPVFNLMSALNAVEIILTWFITIPGVEYVYSPRDYLINVVCLVVEYMLLYVVQTILYKRELLSVESTKTVEELIKVIGAKREDALEANRAKSDFLANMSHEIRTPINAVLGFNEMILRENTDPNVKEFSLDIRSSGNSLLALINDILDFSKIEAGKMEILPVTYDLSTMLNDLINVIGYRAMEKGLSLRVDIDPTLPHVLYGDEVRIKQIITNLLTNAVKYTEDGFVEMQIEYEQLDDYQIEMTVKVKDTGQGIKEEDIEKLYLPFERLDSTRNRNIEGTGLGIPLTRTLLELMGSKLEIESTYGVGSIFSFVLRQEVENWEPIGALDEALKKAKLSESTERHYFTAPAARILTVDDIPINLKVFRSLLKRTQIRIDTANNGMEALAMMRKVKYDMIFLDHMMPEMDGIETYERMKADRFNVNRYVTPVIALTANAVSGAREMYIDKGFEDYLTKPIDSGKLESMLVKYLDPSLVTIIDEFEEDDDGDGLQDGGAESGNDFIRQLKMIPQIDVNAGIEVSGGADIYEQVMREYTETIGMYSARIEEFYNQRDVDNYRIQVHSLKSTSKMAGILKISELAKNLERAAEMGDLEYLQKNTTDLLSMYRELKAPLEKIFGSAQETEEDGRPEIDPDYLKEALSAMREGVDTFDQDLMESVMSELGNYKLTSGYDEVYDKLKGYMADVANEEIAALLDEVLGRM